MSTHELIHNLADAEEQLRDSTFLAPSPNGEGPSAAVRTRIDGLVREFEPVAPAAGWGIFRPIDAERAERERLATRIEVEQYLELFAPLRALLVRELIGRSWLAIPFNRSDMEQRFGTARPFVVHLVDGGEPFAPAVVRHDGTNWWWERVDRRADPRIVDGLRRSLTDGVAPSRLAVPGVTPEYEQAYRILWEQTVAERERCDESDPRSTLREALATGGGELVAFTEQRDTWRVEWETSGGERHYSTVAKDDLTVVTAGICLSGRDREFDLESLVGVVEKRPW